MMIWLVFAVLTATAILVMARPLLRASPAAGSSEVEVYRQQLAELEREAERGTIDPDEAAGARAEIARRLLRTNRQSPGRRPTQQAAGRPGATALLAALGLFLSGGTIALYLAVGEPSLPDQPLEARLDAPVEQQPIGIQVANVERRLHENPNDVRGWTVIAPVYFKLGQFDKAADAWRHAISLGNDGEAALLGLAEALTFANNGIISDAAKQALARAVKQNPKSWRGRLWLGLSAEQNGDRDGAKRIYEAMLGDNPPEEWKKVLADRINGAPSRLAESAVPDAAQEAMIQGMVAKLAQRLKENGADLDGWLELIRSYVVLREDAKAGRALVDAQKQFAGDDAALRKIDALIESLSFKPPPAPAGAAKP